MSLSTQIYIGNNLVLPNLWQSIVKIKLSNFIPFLIDGVCPSHVYRLFVRHNLINTEETILHYSMNNLTGIGILYDFNLYSMKYIRSLQKTNISYRFMKLCRHILATLWDYRNMIFNQFLTCYPAGKSSKIHKSQ